MHGHRGGTLRWGEGGHDTIPYGEGARWDEAFEAADEDMGTPNEIKKLDGTEAVPRRRRAQ